MMSFGISMGFVSPLVGQIYRAEIVCVALLLIGLSLGDSTLTPTKESVGYYQGTV